MKKAMRFTMYLSVWLLCIGVAAIFWTFITDALHNNGFFGDYIGSVKHWDYATSRDVVSPNEEWGLRHYYYNATCIALFLSAIVRIILWVNYYWEDKK